MTTGGTFSSICDAIHLVKGTDRAGLQPATLIESLGLDSLDELEVMMALEESLSIELDQAQISRCRSLTDLVLTIDRILAKA